MAQRNPTPQLPFSDSPLDMEVSQMTVNVQASDIQNLFGTYGEIIEGPFWMFETILFYFILNARTKISIEPKQV